MNDNIPNRYMLILQRVGGGQAAVEFASDSSIHLAEIKPFTDEKSFYKSKKDAKVSKKTMAFIDAITNRFEDFNQMITTLSDNYAPFNYKMNTSYIGIIYNKQMSTFKLSFNDPTLAHIAQVANGNNINPHDATTISYVDQFMQLLDDGKSDFFDCLKREYFNGEEHFNFNKNFINCLGIYHHTKKMVDNFGKYDSPISSELMEDVETYREDVIQKMQSYRSFRELYRFYKIYELDKIQRCTSIREEVIEEDYDTDFDGFKSSWEEARQKTYPRFRCDNDDQITFDDYLKKAIKH